MFATLSFVLCFITFAIIRVGFAGFNDTDSIVDQQDFDPIDLLPHDFSSSNDMENFDVETILCRPCQVDTDCSGTVNATTIGIQNKDHTEIQIECGVNGQQSIVGWLRISERLNLSLKQIFFQSWVFIFSPQIK